MQPQLHDWLLSVLLPVTHRECEKMADGQRRTFKVTIPPEEETVRGYAVFCGRCQIAAERMSPQELAVCRG